MEAHWWLPKDWENINLEIKEGHPKERKWSLVIVLPSGIEAVLQLCDGYTKSLHPGQGTPSEGTQRQHLEHKTQTHHFNIWVFSKKAVTGHGLKNKTEATVTPEVMALKRAGTVLPPSQLSSPCPQAWAQLLTGSGSSSSVPFCTDSGGSSSLWWLFFLDFFLSFDFSSFSFLCFFFLCLEDFYQEEQGTTRNP